MNATSKLTQIFGTLAEQKEDIRNYSKDDINNSVDELLKRHTLDIDGSQTRVYEVLGCSLQNIYLQESLVGKVIYRLTKPGEIPSISRNRRLKEYLPLALNHPNICFLDYINVLSGYLKSGYWLSPDYSHHLVKHENKQWNQEQILNAICLNIPSLRECFNDSAFRDEGIDYFLMQFFQVFSQIIDVSNPKIITSFNQLFKKCSPMRIKKLHASKNDTIIPDLSYYWGFAYLEIKQDFLKIFNALPYDPNPYGHRMR